MFTSISKQTQGIELDAVKYVDLQTEQWTR